METIHGPMAQLVAGGVIYQVTLASGMIVTSPSAFGPSDQNLLVPTAIVSESGQILSAPVLDKGKPLEVLRHVARAKQK